MNIDFTKYCIKENATIKETMKLINENVIGAAIVVEDGFKVKGLITDGDIRRALINGKNINESIKGIYNKNYKYVSKFESKKRAKEIMLKYKIRHLPVLNEEGVLTDLYFLDDLISYKEKDNYVFILAGGLGTRLKPLTEKTPKPMLNVGDKPILQTIIEQFKEYGFKNFIISLNYKGDVIEDYFKDGKQFDVNIDYVWETKKLGTAGSIKLAKEKLSKPFIVINGDILTGIDFDDFLNEHMENNNDITVGSRNYEMTIPYGVISTNGMSIKSIEEKPTYSFYISSGVYALNPNVIDYIPDNVLYNMTDLIKDVTQDNLKAGIYHIKEYWVDIGQITDYKKANDDVNKYF